MNPIRFAGAKALASSTTLANLTSLNLLINKVGDDEQNKVQKDDKIGEFPVHLVVSVGNPWNAPSIPFNYDQKKLPVTSRGNKNGSLGGWGGHISGLLIFVIICIIVGVGCLGVAGFLYLKKKRARQNTGYGSL